MKIASLWTTGLLALGALSAGCGDETAAGGATSGGGGATSSTTTATTTTTTTTGSAGSACGGDMPEGACAPYLPICANAPSACLAPEAACAADPRLLRVSELAFTRPAAFASGVVAATLDGWVAPYLPECQVSGAATFSWLLEIDASAGTLKTGGAKASDTGASGYCFASETFDPGTGPVTLVPTITPATVSAEGLVDAETIDALTLAAYVDAAGTGAILLPFRGLRIHDAQLSPDGACIGAFNAAGLAPDDLCAPTDGVRSFTTAGSIDAHFSLEEADAIVIEVLGESLCVLLSGDPSTYGDGSTPKKCKRDANNVIVFQGDWCAMSDHAATATCFDAMQVQATFAASAVTRKGGC